VTDHDALFLPSRRVDPDGVRIDPDAVCFVEDLVAIGRT